MESYEQQEGCVVPIKQHQCACDTLCVSVCVAKVYSVFCWQLLTFARTYAAAVEFIVSCRLSPDVLANCLVENCAAVKYTSFESHATSQHSYHAPRRCSLNSVTLYSTLPLTDKVSGQGQDCLMAKKKRPLKMQEHHTSSCFSRAPPLLLTAIF